MTKPITPQRVNLVTLGVADLERSKAFYGALGWRPADETPSVAFYRMQGMALGLFGLADLAEDQGRKGAALGTGAVTLNGATTISGSNAFTTGTGAVTLKGTTSSSGNINSDFS